MSFFGNEKWCREQILIPCTIFFVGRNCAIIQIFWYSYRNILRISLEPYKEFVKMPFWAHTTYRMLPQPGEIAIFFVALDTNDQFYIAVGPGSVRLDQRRLQFYGLVVTDDRYFDFVARLVFCEDGAQRGG